MKRTELDRFLKLKGDCSMYTGTVRVPMTYFEKYIEGLCENELENIEYAFSNIDSNKHRTFGNGSPMLVLALNNVDGDVMNSILLKVLDDGLTVTKTKQINAGGYINTIFIDIESILNKMMNRVYAEMNG